MVGFDYIQMVLNELETAKADLAALYEDYQIFGGDVYEPASRRANLTLLNEYNEKLEAFESAADAMRAYIERIAQTALERSLIRPLAPGLAELLSAVRGHDPTEDFTHLHTVGCLFLGEIAVVNTWSALYEHVLRALAERGPVRFRALPDTPPFNGQDFNHKFTRSPNDHPIALRELPQGVYCKGTMAVGAMFVNIRRLLAYFEIPESELVIYLREEWRGD